jgi:hypothetical protein
MKPLGTLMKSTTVATRMAREKTSAPRRRTITQARLSSYAERIRP